MLVAGLLVKLGLQSHVLFEQIVSLLLESLCLFLLVGEGVFQQLALLVPVDLRGVLDVLQIESGHGARRALGLSDTRPSGSAAEPRHPYWVLWCGVP